jgi:Ala-tRNA(Pro) deacylase
MLGMNDERAFFQLLAELGIPSETIEHEAVYTANALSERDKYEWEFPVKNILLEDKDKRLTLVTMHLRTPPLDLKQLAKDLGAAGRFSFASAETLGRALAVLPGSVTPFAVMNDRAQSVKLVLDERMRDAKTISAHPLVNTKTTTIAMPDLLKFLAHTGHKPHWHALPQKPQGQD